MKQISFSLLFILFSVLISRAQKTELLIKSSDKGLYLEHKVQAKESLYALGRIYNIDPKIIASFNSLDYNKGLNIDQKLRIPLTSANFIQEGNKGTPIYYKTGNKESLDKVSQLNNNVLKSNLRWWNGITGNEAKSDTKLIVGFIESPSMASITIAGKPIPDQSVFHTKEQPNLDESTKVVKKSEEKPAEKKPELVVVKEEEKKTTAVVVKEEAKPATIDQGYFKYNFQQQIKNTPTTKEETVTAGIFKTTSGWEDAKYYLLIDKVSPGTIVKVINPTNNKAIYAKVLGEMSGIRQNSGLDVRISNAAATALDISEEDKFIVKVNY